MQGQRWGSDVSVAVNVKVLVKVMVKDNVKFRRGSFLFIDKCQFGFVGGSVLTIKPQSTQNLVDCLRFNGWTGACAGQGSTCTVTINSDLTVDENFWTRISGCIPR